MPYDEKNPRFSRSARGDDWAMPDRSAQLADITTPTTLAGRMSASGDFGSIMSGVISGIKTGFEGITGNKFGGGADVDRETAIQEAMTEDDINTMISIRDDEFMRLHDIKNKIPPRVNYVLASNYGTGERLQVPRQNTVGIPPNQGF